MISAPWVASPSGVLPTTNLLRGQVLWVYPGCSPPLAPEEPLLSGPLLSSPPSPRSLTPYSPSAPAPTAQAPEPHPPQETSHKLMTFVRPLRQMETFFHCGICCSLLREALARIISFSNRTLLGEKWGGGP